MTNKLKGFLLSFPAVRKICGWFIALYRWLREGDAFWLTAGVLMLAWLCVSFGEPAVRSYELRLRIVGMVLQLLGITTVFIGFEHTRKQFGHPRAFPALWQWLSRFPWKGPRPIDGSIRMTVTPATAVIEGQEIWPDVSGLSVLDRLGLLEAESKRARTDIRAMQREAGKQKREHVEALEKLHAVIESQSEETAELLESVHTGGLSMSIAGLVWLAFGVVLTSVPDLL